MANMLARRFVACLVTRNNICSSARLISCSASCNRELNFPPSGNELPRPAGIASMMRLPVQPTSEGLDACFVGVSMDIGTSNRSGARFGPRQIRTESVMLRAFNPATGAAPFESLQVADCGDVAFNLYNLPEACRDIRKHYTNLIQNGCKPLTLGGDHTISYPILQAIKDKHGPVALIHVDATLIFTDKHGPVALIHVDATLIFTDKHGPVALIHVDATLIFTDKHGPVALIHVDAHSDTNDKMFGAKINHGSPFRRAYEEGCIEGKRVVQIGLRGSGYDIDAYKWAEDQGFRVVRAEECWHKSLKPLMAEVRSQVGSGPAYITFDIDGLDPAFAPGTGTPEIAGLTVIQGLEIIRGCKGLNIVGCDLVEVSPPYDTTGTTAITAANLLFEMLCILPGVKYYE